MQSELIELLSNSAGHHISLSHIGCSIVLPSLRNCVFICMDFCCRLWAGIATLCVSLLAGSQVGFNDLNVGQRGDGSLSDRSCSHLGVRRGLVPVVCMTRLSLCRFPVAVHVPVFAQSSCLNTDCVLGSVDYRIHCNPISQLSWHGLWRTTAPCMHRQRAIPMALSHRSC